MVHTTYFSRNIGLLFSDAKKARTRFCHFWPESKTKEQKCSSVVRSPSNTPSSSHTGLRTLTQLCPGASQAPSKLTVPPLGPLTFHYSLPPASSHWSSSQTYRPASDRPLAPESLSCNSTSWHGSASRMSCCCSSSSAPRAVPLPRT